MNQNCGNSWLALQVKFSGLTIGEIHVEQFMRYLTHLIEWNKAINLTAILNPKEIIIKHFVDSLGALIAEKLSAKWCSARCRVWGRVSWYPS